jgi:hypothetical protein
MELNADNIKKLADGYYACNGDWLDKNQENDTKIGWRQGFNYAIIHYQECLESKDLNDCSVWNVIDIDENSLNLLTQLDKWIEDCENMLEVFKENNMDVAEISSQAMALAYKNVKNILPKGKSNKRKNKRLLKAEILEELSKIDNKEKLAQILVYIQTNNL